MAIKLNSVKCPECGAYLPIENGREKIFCSYCGTPIIITNENEQVHRHIDEAKIKEAEVTQTVELKKLEIIERKRVAAEKAKKTKIIISIVMGVVGVILMLIDAGMSGIIGLMIFVGVSFIWLWSDSNKDDDLDLGDKVKVPSGISDYESKSYVAIDAMLKGAGFTNIKCVALHDLRTGLIKKPDTVESIVINGQEIASGGKKFSPDATVVISYHSFAGK